MVWRYFVRLCNKRKGNKDNSHIFVYTYFERLDYDEFQMLRVVCKITRRTNKQYMITNTCRILRARIFGFNVYDMHVFK